MPRSTRLQSPELIYHVGSRGVEKLPIYDRTPRDREMFLWLLDETVRRFDWIVYACCLMGNHFHLVLETPKANLSEGMQFLKGEYAQWLNATTGREGALFERRFWSRIALRESYVLELARYVVLNPVRAGLVRAPEEWQWSSYAATVGLTGTPHYLDADGVLGWFGGGATACVRFAQFVGEGIGVACSDEPFLAPSGSDPSRPELGRGRQREAEAGAAG